MADMFDITDEAKAYITDLLSQHPGKALGVLINDKGCGGHKYQWGLLPWDGAEQHDEVIDWPDGRLVIDAHSVMWMLGSRLVLESSPWDTRLAWVNPMVASTCGCGDSFSLAGESSCGS